MSKKLLELLVESFKREDIIESEILLLTTDNIEQGQLDWFLKQIQKRFGEDVDLPIIIGLPAGHSLEGLNVGDLETLGLMKIPDHPMWEDPEPKPESKSVKVLAAKRRKKSEW